MYSTLASFPHVCDDLMGRVDGIVNGGDCEVGVESTVITVVTEIPRVLRPGGISVEQLRRVLGRVDVDRAVLEKPAENAKVASPGMKYKHYAPKADVYMVDASAEDYAAFLHTHSEAAALCFNEDVPYLKNRCVPYGSAADSLSQAHGLFTSLHHLDEIGAKTVYARMPRKSGVGLAVYNRLIRACAFRIVTPNEQLVIGLTGQTGAGKSTVAKQLKARGCVIIDCDAVTHDPSLYAGTCLTELQNAFGRDIIKEAGTFDRRRLARLAFATRRGQTTLNGITHPVIFARAQKGDCRYKAARVIVLDAPTLFEAGADRLCRRVVFVLADGTVRSGRIFSRDGFRAGGGDRMHAQQADGFYIDRSDYTLDNTVAVSADDMDNMLAALGCGRPVNGLLRRNLKKSKSAGGLPILIAGLQLPWLVVFALQAAASGCADAQLTRARTGSIVTTRRRSTTGRKASSMPSSRRKADFDPEAESPVGALGLMQMMPETFDWMQTHIGGEYDASALLDPEISIKYGCALLRVLLNEYDNLATAVCAYNAGMGNVTSWLSDPAYSEDGVTLKEIPFEETRLYVQKVLQYKETYEKLYGGIENG